MSVCLSVLPSASKISAPTGRIFIKFDIWVFSRKSFEKIKRLLYMKTCVCFWNYLAEFFVEWENVSDKSCKENQNTHFVLNNFLFSPENRAVYEIMWKNVLEPDSPQMTIRRTRFACWITKATNTHWEYVIPIVFPLQHLLQDSLPVWHYTYSACSVMNA